MNKPVVRSRFLLVIIALALVVAAFTGSAARAASSSPSAGSAPGAHTADTAASSAPCDLRHTIAKCESTDPTVTLSTLAYGGTGNTVDCTFVWDLNWGDGHSTTATEINPPRTWKTISQHTYAATPKTYTVTATGTASAGCTLNPFVVTFTLTKPTPPACPSTAQPRIYWSQTAGPQGVRFYFTGNGWYANDTVTIHLPSKGIFHVSRNSWRANSSGDWKLIIAVGKSAPLRTYEITFAQTACGGLHISGHFKVTMTRTHYGDLVSAINQLLPAADDIGKLVGGKQWDSSVAHKALNVIGKAQTIVSIAFAGLDIAPVVNDIHALNAALKKAHNNKKNSVVQQDLKQLEADTNKLRDALISIAPELEFVFPPLAS
jgi:hypothetical protein